MQCVIGVLAAILCLVLVTSTLLSTGGYATGIVRLVGYNLIKKNHHYRGLEYWNSKVSRI